MALDWDRLAFSECTHEPFDYRPYRRGRRRCKVCGGYRPLSKMAQEMLNKLIDYAVTEPPFITYLRRVKNA